MPPLGAPLEGAGVHVAHRIEAWTALESASVPTNAFSPGGSGGHSDSQRRGHAQPQRGGVGLQLSSSTTLLSKILSKCLPCEVLEELQCDDWLVQPFQPFFCQNSLVQHSDCFLWHPPDEPQVFLVFRAPGFVFDLKYGDVLDDHEFFLTSKQKRSIKKASK